MWNRTEAVMKENSKNEIEEKAETVIQAEMESTGFAMGKPNPMKNTAIWARRMKV